MRLSMYTTVIFPIFFCVCGLRSRHFCDLPILGEWEKTKMLLISILLIKSVWFSQDSNNWRCSWSSWFNILSLTPHNVIWVHLTSAKVFVNNFRSIWDKRHKVNVNMFFSSGRLYWWDMAYQGLNLTLTWGQISNWPFEINTNRYVIRYEANTMAPVYFLCLSR